MALQADESLADEGFEQVLKGMEVFERTLEGQSLKLSKFAQRTCMILTCIQVSCVFF